jgi:predicted nuclease of restriction endonuclease-like (RecB) superfamily
MIKNIISSKEPQNDKKQEDFLYTNISSIWETARSFSAKSVNSAHSCASWLTGLKIIESEQGGFRRGAYGAGILKNVLQRLTVEYGSGFSVSGLQYMRAFFLEYPDFLPIQHALRVTLNNKNELGKQHAVRVKSASAANTSPDISALLKASQGEDWRPGQLNPNLSWTHYRTLLKVKRIEAPHFYEIESVKNSWSARQLERQINSLLFERLLKSRDKKGVLSLANKGQAVSAPIDIIKDPVILEFLDLPESHRLVESKIETALISKLKDFLLELGSGFAFVGRQRRLTLEGDHFYPDLIFYHINLKCYVIIDLKTKKLTHGDLGQMQMYVHFYDREVKTNNDNPTIGLILCTDKNEAVVKYVLDDKHRQIFASRYQYELPSEEDLKKELRREMELLALPVPVKKNHKS